MKFSLTSSRVSTRNETTFIESYEVDAGHRDFEEHIAVTPDKHA